MKDTHSGNTRSIYIFGVGGAGGNMLQTIREMNLSNIFLVAIDCDKQTLEHVQADIKFQIGKKLTRGLGVGGNPEFGARALEESKEILSTFKDANALHCVIAGLGGGVGSGAGPLITRELSRRGLPVTAVVTMPFNFEGKKRMANAEAALERLKSVVQSPVVIQNQSILNIIERNTTLLEAFEKSYLACEYVVEEILSAISNDAFQTIDVGKRMQFLTIIADTFPDALKDIERQLSLGGTLLHYRPASRIFVPDNNRDLLRAISFDQSMFRVISPRKFEELLCYLYELAGYKVQLTRETRDRGADLLVCSPSPLFGREFLTVVQAKKYDGRRKVGEREIRDLAGAQFIFNAQKAQCITTYGYTGPARKTAKELSIDLGLFWELLRLMNNEFRKG